MDLVNYYSEMTFSHSFQAGGPKYDPKASVCKATAVRTINENNWKPLLIYFHSGSFIGGTLDYHMPIVSRYAV